MVRFISYIHPPSALLFSLNTHVILLYIGSHILHTPRGTLSAQKVIYCSNAYTATLLPEFKGKIAPFRGQCSAIVPTRAVSGTKMLKETMSYRWGLVRIIYIPSFLRLSYKFRVTMILNLYHTERLRLHDPTPQRRDHHPRWWALESSHRAIHPSNRRQHQNPGIHEASERGYAGVRYGLE